VTSWAGSILAYTTQNLIRIALSMLLFCNIRNAVPQVLVCILMRVFTARYSEFYCGFTAHGFPICTGKRLPTKTGVVATCTIVHTFKLFRMDWPARSPDLNPIQHVWDMLQRAISARPVNSTTVQELRRALLKEWVRIPLISIRRLVSSMRRRCQAVINANGHHT